MNNLSLVSELGSLKLAFVVDMLVVFCWTSGFQTVCLKQFASNISKNSFYSVVGSSLDEKEEVKNRGSRTLAIMNIEVSRLV